MITCNVEFSEPNVFLRMANINLGEHNLNNLSKGPLEAAIHQTSKLWA